MRRRAWTTQRSGMLSNRERRRDWWKEAMKNVSALYWIAPLCNYNQSRIILRLVTLPIARSVKVLTENSQRKKSEDGNCSVCRNTVKPSVLYMKYKVIHYNPAWRIQGQVNMICDTWGSHEEYCLCDKTLCISVKLWFSTALPISEETQHRILQR